MFRTAIPRFSRVVVVSLLAVFATCTAANAATQTCGDLDGNGNIVTSDALRLLRLAVGQSVSIECPAGLSCWDINGNNACDAEEDKTADQACGTEDCQGPQGEPGSPGPVSLEALQGSQCTRGDSPGTLEVSVDPDTGLVTMTCVVGCPCFDTATLHAATVDWNHCARPNSPGECDLLCDYLLCDEASWDGDDNCTFSGAYASVFFNQFGEGPAFSCSFSDGQGAIGNPLTERQAQACVTHIEAVIVAEGLCCEWNNNVPLCQ